MTSSKEADYEHQEEANEAQWSIIYKTIYTSRSVNNLLLLHLCEINQQLYTYTLDMNDSCILMYIGTGYTNKEEIYNY